MGCFSGLEEIYFFLGDAALLVLFQSNAAPEFAFDEQGAGQFDISIKNEDAALSQMAGSDVCRRIISGRTKTVQLFIATCLSVYSFGLDYEPITIIYVIRMFQCLEK